MYVQFVYWYWGPVTVARVRGFSWSIQLVAWRGGLFLTEGEIEVLSVSSLFLDGGGSVRGCRCVYTHAHTHCTWGTWCEPRGQNETPSGPEESRWTKSWHINPGKNSKKRELKSTWIWATSTLKQGYWITFESKKSNHQSIYSYICTKYTCVYIYAGRRDEVMAWTDCFCSLTYSEKQGKRCNHKIENSKQSCGKMAKMWILFRSINSWARILGRPWTGLIGSAPVQMSGCCLGAALSWLRDGLLRGLVVPHWPFVSPWTVTLVILGLEVLRAHLLGLCCTAAFPPIFLQLRKGPLWSCAELLQSYALCSSDQCGTVKPRLPAVCELFWGMLGSGDGGLRGIGVSGSGYNEVLALEVLNVVWVRRMKETCRVPSASAPRAFAAAPSFQACLHSCISTFCMCVCIYVYVCMCANMYICMYMHVCMYLYIYAFIHMCMCMCMHICA